jgi:hypothetical protein
MNRRQRLIAAALVALLLALIVWGRALERGPEGAWVQSAWFGGGEPELAVAEAEWAGHAVAEGSGGASSRTASTAGSAKWWSALATPSPDPGMTAEYASAETWAGASMFPTMAAAPPATGGTASFAAEGPAGTVARTIRTPVTRVGNSASDAATSGAPETASEAGEAVATTTEQTGAGAESDAGGGSETEVGPAETAGEAVTQAESRAGKRRLGLERRLAERVRRIEAAAEAVGEAKMIERMAAEFGVRPELLHVERSDASWGDLVIAHTLHANARGSRSASALLELHAQGESWSSIAAKLGLESREVATALAAEEKVATGERRADARVAVIHGSGSHAGLSLAGATGMPAMTGTAGAGVGAVVGAVGGGLPIGLRP